MIKIRNTEDLFKYVKLRLGYPLVNVEVAEEQFELVVDECLKDCWRYNSGTFTFLNYGIFEMKKGKTQYNLRDVSEAFPFDKHGDRIPSTIDMNDPIWENSYVNIEQVVEVKASSRYQGGINAIFSPMHAWYHDAGGKQVLDGGGMVDAETLGFWQTRSPGNSSTLSTLSNTSITGGSSDLPADPLMPMTQYFLAMNNLGIIEYLFGEEFEAHWRNDAGILQIYPTPKKDVPAMITYFGKENKKFVFNNILFQKYVLAKTKMQWGQNLSKFRKSLVGGGEINASDLLDSGKNEAEEILEQIKGESEFTYMIKG